MDNKARYQSSHAAGELHSWETDVILQELIGEPESTRALARLRDLGRHIAESGCLFETLPDKQFR